MTDLVFNRLNQRKLFFVPTYEELTFPTIYFGKQVEISPICLSMYTYGVMICLPLSATLSMLITKYYRPYHAQLYGWL